MHRLITGAGAGQQVDHINGNKLDNRRSNLRLCTQSENMRNRGATALNTSGFKGVHWSANDRKWRAGIKVEGKRIFLGLYLSKEEAAEAYNRAAESLHGLFASKNKL